MDTAATNAITPRRPGKFVSQTGRTLLGAGLLALAIPTGVVGLLQGAGELKLPFNLFLTDQRLPGIFRLHMLASGLSLLLIPLTVMLARYNRPWHRTMGRLTGGCVLVGALSAFPVAIMSESVVMARAGFLAQGSVWLVLLLAGVRAIRDRNILQHARFMLAMAAVASGAIWVRLTTALATAWDLPFDALYASAAWAGWLLPLVLVWRWSAAPSRLFPA